MPVRGLREDLQDFFGSGCTQGFMCCVPYGTREAGSMWGVMYGHCPLIAQLKRIHGNGHPRSMASERGDRSGSTRDRSALLIVGGALRSSMSTHRGRRGKGAGARGQHARSTHLDSRAGAEHALESRVCLQARHGCTGPGVQGHPAYLCKFHTRTGPSAEVNEQLAYSLPGRLVDLQSTAIPCRSVPRTTMQRVAQRGVSRCTCVNWPGNILP
jgi:hypothetical protein